MRSLKILKWLTLIIFLLLMLLCVYQSLGAKNWYDYYILVDLKELKLILKDVSSFQIVAEFKIAGPASINYLRPLPKNWRSKKRSF